MRFGRLIGFVGARIHILACALDGREMVRQLMVPILVIGLHGCSDDAAHGYQPTYSDRPPVSKRLYVFGVHPLHNPERLFEVFEPLTRYLSREVPDALFRVEASRNYAAYEDKLYARQFDFALPNPLQTIEAVDRGYRVFAKMGDDQEFRGIILVRKDTGIDSVGDLRGKSMSFPAPTALAATIMPLHYLQTQGIDIQADIRKQYVGSQESAVMNTALGLTDAAAT